MSRTSVIGLELEAMEKGSASYVHEGRTLHVRGYQQINGDDKICTYSLSGAGGGPLNRGDAISFVATGKILRERA